jgi:hypothetical protein
MTILIRIAAGAALTLAALTGGAPPVAAQQLADRVRAVRDGDVRFTFPARDGVCANANGQGWAMRGNREGEWESGCTGQPVRIALTVERGSVVALRSYVGGRWVEGDGAATDLGDVPAAQAAAFLVRIAATAPGSAAERAIGASALAEGANLWREFLAIARDERRPQGARRSATFWVGMAAGDRITHELGAMVAEDSLDLDVREHAVFALSRRPADEGIPALIRIVRSDVHPRIRQRALFWLGQSRDERALRLFEEILGG